MALRQCSTRLIDAYSCRPCVSRIRNLRGETKIIIEIAKTAARGLRRGWSERAMFNLGLAPKSPSTRMAALYSAFMLYQAHKNNVHDHAGSDSGEIYNVTNLRQ